jgi:hypothetical protein
MLAPADMERVMEPTDQTLVAVVDLDGLDPVARCQEVWAGGGMGRPKPAPPLVACVDPATADRVITAELRAHGFTDWRVEPFRMDAAGRISGPLAKVGRRGCAMIGYRGDRRVVELVVEER